LNRLIPNEKERIKMGNEAAKKARESYTWDSVGKAYSQLLEQLAGKAA